MGNIQSVLAFDGADDYISAPDCPALRIEQYTIELWLKPEGKALAAWDGIIGKPGRNFNIWLHRDGSIHHRFHTDQTADASIPSTDGGSVKCGCWSHVTITNNGKTAKTFINGKLETEGPVDGKLIVDNQPLYVARNLDGKNGNYFQGRMADIRIWNQANSLEKIEDLKDRRLCGSELGLVLYWPLDRDEGETIDDLTGNGVLGTLHGGTWEKEEPNGELNGRLNIGPVHRGKFSGPCALGTALEDVGYWNRWAKHLPKDRETGDDESFQRGRIWS